MPKEIPGIGLVYELSELSELFSVHETTVVRYWRRGRLPGRKVGRGLYFTADAVKAFLEGQSDDAKKGRKTPATGERKKSDAVLEKEAKQREQIIKAMKQSNNVISEAAEILGWPVRSLRERVTRFKLFPAIKKSADQPKNKPLFEG